MDRKTQAPKIIHRFFRLTGCVTVIFLSTARAQLPREEISEHPDAVYQVTSHPDADLAPRISPDGKWMTFVSRRSGNYDIWIKNLETGRTRRLTDHEADDYHPVWDKKNRYIIFVSQRSDAKGDLYRLNLRLVRGELIVKGEPERLTNYLGFDGFPTISEFDEHIAWVSDRTGRPEIWLMTKRAQAIRQLTYGGATHPAWSPKQSFLAFTSFREDGSNGDIWLINLYAPREWVEVKTPLDSLERPMWPVTRGEAADGFPAWSPDAKTIIFCRSDHDDNGDGLITPSDRSVLWAVDVSHLPQEHPVPPNPSFRIFRETFDERIAHSAKPILSAKYNAAQPEYGIDRRIYFSSEIKGNSDIFSLPDTLLRGQAPHAEHLPPLPNNLSAKDLPSFVFELPQLTIRQRNALYDRIVGLQRIMDSQQTDAEQIAYSAYEIAVCSFFLGDSQRCLKYVRFILSEYPSAEIAPFAELLQNIQAWNSIDASPVELSVLQQEIYRLKAGVAPNKRFAAEAELLLGDLYERLGKPDEAETAYRRATEKAEAFPQVGAEAWLRLGRLQKSRGKYAEALVSYLSVIKNYSDNAEKSAQARSELLGMFTRGAADDGELLSRYKIVLRQFFTLDLFVIEPFLRMAELHTKNGRLREALELYDFILAQFADLTNETFEAHLGRAEVIYRMGDLQQATAALSETATFYRRVQPRAAARVENRLTELLYQSARDLMAAQQYGQAAARLKKILEIDPHHLQAHQSYIECGFLLNLMDQILADYNEAVRRRPGDNILLYAQGLAYSYKGAFVDPSGCEAVVSDVEALERSNQILYKALSLDYNLIDAYLVLSFNAELLESHQIRRQNMPKSFFRKALGTATAPLIWLYHTLTFYEETKPPRYYESAIQELTQAMALNDEELYPRREALLALNMANNYYNLGEFGFRKAYEYYHTFLKYDSSFIGLPQEALIKERMGHCAIFVNDQLRGPQYLKRAVEIYSRMNNQERLLLNMKRLALLYEVGENHQEALNYYLAAAEMEERLGRYDGLLRSRRSAALHYYALGRYEEAVRTAEEALAMLESGLVPRKKSKPIYLQVGLLDLYVPIPFDLRKVGAKSTIDISTEEEEAFLYTILAQVFIEKKDFDRGLEFYQKKFAIYELRHDYDAQAVFQNNMGYLYFLKGDYDNAWRMFTNSYWWCVRTKYVYGQLLNLENAAQVVLTIGREEDPKKKVNFAKYHRWITGKLADLLAVTRKEEAFYAALHARYRLLLADLLTLPYIDPPMILEDRLSFFEALAKAEKHLEEAERLAKQYRLIREEVAALDRRAENLCRTGELEAAVPIYLKAREIAAQNELVDLLCRIDTALGGLRMQLPQDVSTSLADASFYIQEAVRLGEKRPLENVLLSAGQVRRIVEAPYRQLIELQMSRGEAENALLTAERMRSRVFFQIMQRDRPEIGGELEQKLFYRADSLAEELRKRADQTDRAPKRDPSLIEEVQALQQELESVLETIRRKAPRLEPLLRPLDLPLAEIQNRLLPDEALLSILYAKDGLMIWRISRQSVQLFRPLIRPARFRELLTAWRSALAADSLNESVSEELKSVFADLPFEGINRLFLIPEESDLLFPWSSLSSICGLPNVAGIVSSLTAFIQAPEHRRFPALTILTSDSLIEEEGQNEEGFSAAALLQNPAEPPYASVLHLSGKSISQPVFPTVSRISTNSEKSWTPAAIIKKRADVSLVALDVREGELAPEALIAWERAVYIGGISHLLVSLWPTADSSRFLLKSFFRYLKELPPAGALSAAQKEASEKGISPHYWAGFQLYGIDRDSTVMLRGRNEADEWIARGNAARRAREWHRAVECYLEAYKVVAADREKSEKVAEYLLASALNGNQWNEAVGLLRQQIAYYSQRNMRQKEAAAQMQLAVVYHQQGAAGGELQALQEYRRLCRTYSISFDDASPFAETARLYAENGDSERAALLLLEAAERYSRLDRRRPQIESLLEAAKLLGEAGFEDKALDFAISAAEIAAKNGQFDLEARANALLGYLWFQIGSIDKSQQTLQYALYLAQKHNYQRIAAEIKLLAAEQELKSFSPISAERILEKMDAADLDPPLKVRRYLLLSRLERAVGDTGTAAAFLHKALLEASWSDNAALEQEAAEASAVHAVLSGNTMLAAEEMKRAVLLDPDRPLSRSAIRRRFSYALFSYLAGRTEEAAREANEIVRLCDRLYLFDCRSAAEWLLSCAQTDSALAVRHALDAAAFAVKVAYQPMVFRAYFRLQELAEDTHDEAALGYLVAAEEALSRTVPRTEYDEYAEGLMPLEEQFYRTAVKVFVRSNRLREALQTADLHRNAEFVRATRRRRLLFNDVDQPLLNRFFRLQEKLNRLQSAMLFLCDPQSVFASKDSLLVKKQAAALQDSLAMLRESFRASQPRLAPLFFGLKGFAPEAPLPEGNVLISLYCDAEQIYVWRRKGNEIALHRQPFDALQMRNVLKTMQQLDINDDIGDFARLLYKIVIDPWQSDVKKAQSVVLVPFEQWYDVPWSMLTDETGSFLGLEKQISLQPWSFAAATESDIALPAENGCRIIFIGNRTATGTEPFYQSLTAAIQRYTDESLILPPSQLNTAAFAGAVLIAGRLQWVAINPWMTHDDRSEPNLSVRNWFKWNSPPRSVVFVQSFPEFNKGKEAAVASAVADYLGCAVLLPLPFGGDGFASVVLVKRYVRGLCEGLAPAEALRMAQRKVFDHLDRRPKAWACFVLFNSLK